MIYIRGNDERAEKLRHYLVKFDQNILTLGNGETGMKYAVMDYFENEENVSFYIPGDYSRKTIREMLNDLENRGVKNSAIHILDIQKDKSYSVESFQKFSLDYLEYHVCDHCNLKCSGCSHFSSLVSGEVFTDFELWKRDMERLHNLIPQIDLIRILGGEPLLHRELSKFIIETRQMYPDANIVMTTNGLLIPKMNSSLIQTLKEMEITVELTLYQPLVAAGHELLEFLRDNDLNYVVLMHGVAEFDRILLKRPVYTALEAKKRCLDSCVEFRNGRLFQCPVAAFLPYYNKYYNAELPEETGLDIYEQLSEKEIRDYLQRPIELCKYCAIPVDTRKKFKWRKIQESENDWVLLN